MPSQRMNQSAIDKCNHVLSDKFEGYDPEEGLPKYMSCKQKVDFVKYTFVKNMLKSRFWKLIGPKTVKIT